ncbi:rod shape-determining protein RodA [Fictibacillus sp. KIGAM418]|uniref:Rod shape-determining protein RodA n=1 Tax=Fictibacillus marinisediminis TaxID=2878389 RepID=A0A9X2BF17_9BACL|nr:FtsW/RodA/SpoVE family cell cycle protein [Fictibacillus marinisediminis]MCK6256767.1 rod shape-determining protein RodA [Fictibacillus marinisediminis]
MENNRQSPLQQIDYNLIFLLFLMICISCMAIYSAQEIAQYDSNFVIKQLMWYAVGAFAVAGVMILDFDQFRKLSWYLYGFGILLLIGIVIAPESLVPNINGARAWFRFGPFALQPSELMKVALIISISNTIATHNEKYIVRTLHEDLLLIGKIALIVMPPMLLILMQPDLGTSLVFIALTLSLMLVSGIRWRIIAVIILIGVLFITLLVWIYFTFPQFFLDHILDEYQLERFYAWLDPYGHKDEGYHIRNALMAIGSGQLFGKGFTHGSVYLPEAQTDFIFSIVGEEWGFIGTSVLISLFFLMIYRMINTALESNEAFGSYLCAGVIGMVTFQVFQNIGMNIQVMPITGIPLPFISYGGSSVLAQMIAFGLVLNVRSRTRKYMFE